MHIGSGGEDIPVRRGTGWAQNGGGRRDGEKDPCAGHRHPCAWIAVSVRCRPAARKERSRVGSQAAEQHHKDSRCQQLVTAPFPQFQVSAVKARVAQRIRSRWPLHAQKAPSESPSALMATRMSCTRRPRPASQRAREALQLPRHHTHRLDRGFEVWVMTCAPEERPDATPTGHRVGVEDAARATGRTASAGLETADTRHAATAVQYLRGILE